MGISKYYSALPFLKSKYFIFGSMSYYLLCTIVLCVYKIYWDYPKSSTSDEKSVLPSNWSYPTWSISSLLLLIPLFIYNIFDIIHTSSSSPSSFSYSLFSIVLTAALGVPNIINYIMWNAPNIPYTRIGVSVQLQLFILQLRMVNICILSLTFLCGVNTSDDVYFKLKQSISNIVPCFIVTLMFSKSFYLIGTTLSMYFQVNEYHFAILWHISFVFDTWADFISIFCYMRLIMHHFKQTKLGKFESHNQLSDILHTITISGYLIIAVILFAIYGVDYFLEVISYYMFLVIVILFVVIPNRVHLFHVTYNETKLDVRANLINHLSQQMQNPIKDAIALASEAIQDLEDYKSTLFTQFYDTNIEIIIGNIDEILQDTLESCKVSEMTLTDLFILDQLEDEKLEINMENVNPWDLVRSVASPFSVVARSSNIKFTIDSSYSFGWPNHIYLQCDKFKLSQVIRNLISNALKFTPNDGEVQVMLQLIECNNTNSNDNNDVSNPINNLSSSSTESVKPTSSCIRISVSDSSDSGAGISADNQKKMFGQYVQFNAAQLQKGKGSGLGLWISKSKCSSSYYYYFCLNSSYYF